MFLYCLDKPGDISHALCDRWCEGETVSLHRSGIPHAQKQGGGLAAGSSISVSVELSSVDSWTSAWGCTRLCLGSASFMLWRAAAQLLLLDVGRM